VVIFFRRNLPESPRWLLTHGREDEAERAIADIERRVEASGDVLDPVDESRPSRSENRRGPDFCF